MGRTDEPTGKMTDKMDNNNLLQKAMINRVMSGMRVFIADLSVSLVIKHHSQHQQHVHIYVEFKQNACQQLNNPGTVSVFIWQQSEKSADEPHQTF